MHLLQRSRFSVGALVGFAVFAGAASERVFAWQSPMPVDAPATLSETPSTAPRLLTAPAVESTQAETANDAASAEPAPLPVEPGSSPFEPATDIATGESDNSGSRVSFGDSPDPLQADSAPSSTVGVVESTSPLGHAEQQWRRQPELALVQIRQTLKEQPDHAQGNAILAEIQLASGQISEALATVESALEHAPSDFRLQRLRAEALLQLTRWQEAEEAIARLIDKNDAPPVERSEAFLLQGDLAARGPAGDIRKAMEHHWEAARVAADAAGDADAATRCEGVRLSLAAYLAIARDLGLGKWRNSPQAFAQWVSHAQRTAEALAPAADMNEWRFDVECRALEASAASAGKLDPNPYAAAAKERGAALLDETTDKLRRAQIQGRLGTALLQAADALRAAGEQHAALDFASDAQRLLEASLQYRDNVAEHRYRLIRVYAMLGAERATAAGDHRAAVAWYEKAAPLLDRPGPPARHAETPRFGQALVNMAISYWSIEQHDKALALTERGLQAMQQAVEQGQLARTALAAPLSNLAHMNQRLGNTEQADRYQTRLVDFQTPIANEEDGK